MQKKAPVARLSGNGGIELLPSAWPSACALLAPAGNPCEGETGGLGPCSSTPPRARRALLLRERVPAVSSAGHPPSLPPVAILLSRRLPFVSSVGHLSPTRTVPFPFFHSSGQGAATAFHPDAGKPDVVAASIPAAAAVTVRFDSGSTTQGRTPPLSAGRAMRSWQAPASGRIY
uniref:Uncharacterized protein n=1 Tax=Leersia perrieri TaxID=77586 RepID=A0A0D9VUY2_9ORYZ